MPKLDRDELIPDLADAIALNPAYWDMLTEAIQMYLDNWPETEPDTEDLMRVARDYGLDPDDYYRILCPNCKGNQIIERVLRFVNTGEIDRTNYVGISGEEPATTYFCNRCKREFPRED